MKVEVSSLQTGCDIKRPLISRNQTNAKCVFRLIDRIHLRPAACQMFPRCQLLPLI